MFRKISILAIILVGASAGFGQINGIGGGKGNEALGKTWGGPSAYVIANVLRKTRTATSTAQPRRPSKVVPVSKAVLDVVKFKPVGESGVPLALATTLGTSGEQVDQLNDSFRQLREVYQVEIAKDGKSNDVAAAITYFIAVNVGAYHGTEMASDEEVDKFYAVVRTAIGSAPEFSRLSNAEKQQMHDWLVCMAGFVLVTYLDAKANNNQAGLATAAQLADLSMKVSLGIEISQISTANGRLSLK